MNQNLFSLMFSCEGIFLYPFGAFPQLLFDVDRNYTNLNMTIQFTTEVASVVVVVPPPSSVTESEYFENNTIVMVLDAQGNPIPNKYVFAM